MNPSPAPDIRSIHARHRLAGASARERGAARHREGRDRARGARAAVRESPHRAPRHHVSSGRSIRRACRRPPVPSWPACGPEIGDAVPAAHASRMRKACAHRVRGRLQPRGSWVAAALVNVMTLIVTAEIGRSRSSFGTRAIRLITSRSLQRPKIVCRLVRWSGEPSVMKAR